MLSAQHSVKGRAERMIRSFIFKRRFTLFDMIPITLVSFMLRNGFTPGGVAALLVLAGLAVWGEKEPHP